MTDPSEDAEEPIGAARGHGSAPRFSGKRSREEDVSGEILTIAEVQEIISDVNKKRDDVLHYIGTEKVSKDRKKLSDFASEISNALTKLSSAYLSKLAAESVATTCERAVYRACNSIDNAVKQLITMPNNSENASYANVTTRYSGGQGSGLSFGAAKKLAQKPAIFSDMVTLDRAKPIPISSATRFVVGPIDSVKNDFISAKQTKEVFVKSLDPVKLKLKTKRINYTVNNAIVVEAENVDLNGLRECPDLLDAGLEVKEDEKLDPRIIVHGIPVEYTKEEILQSFVELNLPEHHLQDAKIVSLFPARDKTHRSCIIEIKPSCRKVLQNLSRVYIKWLSCRFADHISVLQCFKCLKFGHKAAACKNSVHCSHCAGDHDSSKCSTDDRVPRCYNCVSAKISNVSHEAFDKTKCSLLRSRLERKSSRVNYGS